MLALLLLAALQSPTPDYPSRVEIRRTAHGVPHILAEDMGAMGYGLAWAQLEDHGPMVVLNLVRARGELSRLFGPDSLESDYTHVETHALAVATYSKLSADLRRVQEGWAAAVNRWVETHPAVYARYDLPTFTPHDVAALWVDEQVEPAVRRFQRAQARRRSAMEPVNRDNIGSNAWAFGPGRTTTGNPILLRNPHIGWRGDWYSTYYEAQITVPGVVNFYGDFRVGFPFYFNGGFNEALGWATTNNGPDLEEVYALRLDPARVDHVLFDGGSIPLERKVLSVRVKRGARVVTEQRTVWRTALGPVIDRTDTEVHVLKSPGWEEYRKAEQFLAMMKARNLAEWTAAMAMRAHTESNLTYADRDGNIFYIWNAALPQRPHAPLGEAAAVPAATTDDVWTTLYPLDALPQLLNPPTGYLQNENDPFHFTNVESPIDSAHFPPPDFPAPEMRLRSQLGVALVTSQDMVSVDDVIRLKHSTRMLAAERMVDDLVAAAQATNPTGDLAQAVEILAGWDKTASPDARGAVLFTEWFDRYYRESGSSTAEREARAWATPWSSADPVGTPYGLGDPARAVRTLAAAAAAVRKEHGRLDPAWGDLVRVIRGDVDVPVGGCAGMYGCFRVLSLRPTGDGRYQNAGGDGWVLVVEFTKDGPQARSVLAYGESSIATSPWYSDQAAMYARGELKPVAFSEAEIAAQLVRAYRPE
ncbi:MAG: penicillin acylase family protein [Gemmatimonadales bacterium]